MTQETCPVQMRLRPETLEAIDNLKVFYQTDNRTDVVARSIRLTDQIAAEILKGGVIEVHRQDGSVYRLMFA